MPICSLRPKDHDCRPHTSKLCIRLLDVAQWGHELLARDWLTIVQQVTLGKQSQLIGQNIGIGSDASDAACHITTRHTRITYMMQSHRISFLLRCTSMQISSQPSTKLHTIFSSVYSFFTGLPDLLHAGLSLRKQNLWAQLKRLQAGCLSCYSSSHSTEGNSRHWCQTQKIIHWISTFLDPPNDVLAKGHHILHVPFDTTLHIIFHHNILHNNKFAW